MGARVEGVLGISFHNVGSYESCCLLGTGDVSVILFILPQMSCLHTFQ